jgi:hypothetical protein
VRDGVDLYSLSDKVSIPSCHSPYTHDLHIGLILSRLTRGKNEHDGKASINRPRAESISQYERTRYLRPCAMQSRVIAAFVFCLTGFIISLLILTASSEASFLEDAALLIVRYQSYLNHPSIFSLQHNIDYKSSTRQYVGSTIKF